MQELLLKTVLVGTSKAGIPPLQPGDDVDQLLSGLSVSDGESQLLLRAGAESVRQLAGVKPQRVKPLSPGPSGHPAEVSPRLAAVVKQAFAVEAKELLQELLTLLQSAARDIPHELLPQFLDVSDLMLRELILPVLGDRGRWLARFRAEWNWVEGSAADLSQDSLDALRRRWLDGSIGERCHVLTRVRVSSPVEARCWLAEEFAKEKPQNRVRLLEPLRTGLAGEDEEFLNVALTDRSEPVRGLAAGLLSLIPGSALAERMRQRAEGMLQFVPSFSEPGLECHPPEKLERDWIADGVPAKAPAGRGQRAYWTEHVLSHVAPSHWCGHFSLTPAQLLLAVKNDVFARSVVEGWTQAVLRFAPLESKSSAWIEDLWAWWRDQYDAVRGDEVAHAANQLAALLALMPPAVAAENLLHTWEMDTAELDPLLMRLLDVLPRPWDEAVGRRYLRRVRQILKTRTDHAAYQWAGTLLLAARRIPPECFAEALLPWECADAKRASFSTATAQREVDRFLELVKARQSLYNELVTLPSLV